MLDLPMELANRENRHMNLEKRIFNLAVCTVVLALVLLTPVAVQAHERVEVGPYVLIVGWEVEPVIVGERNAILLQVTEDGEPVDKLEGTLDIVVSYAGESFTGNLAPAPELGLYLTDIYPTVRGQYEVHLSGDINGELLDLRVEPEEVLSAAVLQFPETQPQARTLHQEIAALDERLRTANQIAIGAAILGLAGLGVGFAGLLRRR